MWVWLLQHSFSEIMLNPIYRLVFDQAICALFNKTFPGPGRLGLHEQMSTCRHSENRGLGIATTKLPSTRVALTANDYANERYRRQHLC